MVSTDVWAEMQDWFIAYQAGDESAVRPLFEGLKRRIDAALHRKGCKPEDAAELSQIILLKIHLSRERYQPSLPLRAWVVTIIERSVVDFWRKTRRHVPVSLDEQDLAADDGDWFSFSPENRLKLQDIDRRLGVLKPLDRQIVDLYAFDGLPLEEIGTRLGLSVGAIKLRIHRCRKLLRGTELLVLFLLARLKP